MSANVVLCGLLEFLHTTRARGSGVCYQNSDSRFNSALALCYVQLRGVMLQAPLKVGNQQVTASITILEDNSMPFLFGLDMLRRYQCSIDLHKNVLRFGSINNAELPFLADHELPARLRREDSDEQAGGSAGVGEGVGMGSASGPATLPNSAPGALKCG